MKQLTLELKKRLLIVEFEDQQHLDNVISCHKTGIRFMSDNEEPTKLICKGSELTEDISEGLAHSMNFGTEKHPDIGYLHSIKDNYWAKTALESFISAIEAKQIELGIKIDLSKSLIFEIL